jgi:hypothetical protein
LVTLQTVGLDNASLVGLPVVREGRANIIGLTKGRGSGYEPYAMETWAAEHGEDSAEHAKMLADRQIAIDHAEHLNLTKFAWIETWYDGGDGDQSATVYVDYEALGNKTKVSINIALQELGVKPKPGLDEFDTIGLSKYRMAKHFHVMRKAQTHSLSHERPSLWKLLLQAFKA